MSDTIFPERNDAANLVDMQAANGLVPAQSADPVGNWWARRWLQALIRVMDPHRLAGGQQYARAGRVLAMDVQPGLVLAQVQGTRPRPYRQRIELRVFSGEEWERALAKLASQALFTAQLLNGEMPENIEDAFRLAELELFPAASEEIVMTCTCSDWARPCKHLAAVLLLLGQALTADPFLLFVLRGRDREQLMTALRDLRAASTLGSQSSVPDLGNDVSSSIKKPDLTLEQKAERFWKLGVELADIQVRVVEPEIEMETLKLLGDPAFSQDPRLLDKLAEVYHRVTRQAIRVAYASHETKAGSRGSVPEGLSEGPRPPRPNN